MMSHITKNQANSIPISIVVNAKLDIHDNITVNQFDERVPDSILKLVQYLHAKNDFIKNLEVYMIENNISSYNKTHKIVIRDSNYGKIIKFI